MRVQRDLGERAVPETPVAVDRARSMRQRTAPPCMGARVAWEGLSAAVPAGCAAPDTRIAPGVTDPGIPVP